MKVGDKITCVDTTGSQSLEYRENYVVGDINQYGNIQVNLAKSPYKILAHYYKPERFIQNTIDFTKSYITRSGKKVRLLAHGSDKKFPIVGEILSKDGKVEELTTWTEEGSLFGDRDSRDDLVEAEKSIDFDDFQASVFADKSVYFSGADINFSITSSQMEEIVKLWNSFE